MTNQQDKELSSDGPHSEWQPFSGFAVNFYREHGKPADLIDAYEHGLKIGKALATSPQLPVAEQPAGQAVPRGVKTTEWIIDLQQRLMAQSAEIASEGHNGWGNTMAEAACLLKLVQSETAAPHSPVAQMSGDAFEAWREAQGIGKSTMEAYYARLAWEAASHPSNAAPVQPVMQAPVGWKLVPIEPTDEQISWGHRAQGHVRGTYSTMIKHAPQPVAASPSIVPSDERIAFEEWCKREGLDATRFENRNDEINGDYWYQEVLTGWRAWQARALLTTASNAEQDAPIAWMRKTDITEWTDSEPETDGWTPLCEQPAATVPPAVQVPSERDIVEMCEKAGLWPNTVHNWIEQFKRYNAELLRRFTTASNAGNAAPAVIDVRDAAIESVAKHFESPAFDQQKVAFVISEIRALQSPPQTGKESQS